MNMISIDINTDTAEQAMDKGIEVRRAVGDSLFEYAEGMAEGIKNQFISQQNMAPRGQTASQMGARRINMLQSEVFIPQKARYLDSMEPHYVALNRGRLITEWARRYFGTMVKSGMSKVSYGSRGGIKGAIYVTPDPFIIKGLEKSKNRLNSILNKKINKALAGG